MAEETNHNDAGEVAPSTVEQQAPSVSEENAPSTDSDVATDIPTANAPAPEAVNPEVNPNASGEKSSTEASTPDDSAQVQPDAKKTAQAAKADKPAAAKAAKADKPAAAKAAKKDEQSEEDKPAAKAPKKEKAPAVEDKPFVEFIQQDYLPALKTALEKKGIQNLELKFDKKPLQEISECWQVNGSWQGGKRNFNLYFPEEDIQKQRAFSCFEGSRPSIIEPFLCDERKVTLDLMVFGVTQRLNAQKWLQRN